MSEPAAPPATIQLRPRRRRWPYVVIGLLLLAVVSVVGVYAYLDIAADSELQGVLADTYRRDPRWRLEDVEADRAFVPYDRNSAIPAMAAEKLLPKHWPIWERPEGDNPPDIEEKRRLLEESFQNQEPQQLLRGEQINALRSEMNRAAAAVSEARKLVDLPEGRYPITYTPDFLDTRIPYTQDARLIFSILSNDAMLRAQDGDADGALSSCRGTLNAARSIGDEPLLISLLVRIAGRRIAVNHAERVLAQGEPSEDALRAFQELLEKEEPEPLLLWGVRGERAGLDQLMEAIQSGKVKLSPQDLACFDDFVLGSGVSSAPSLDELLLVWTPAYKKSERAAVLRFMNQAVEIADLPPEQRRAAYVQLKDVLKHQPVYVRLLYSDEGKVSDICQRSQAQLRSAIAETAAERCRRAKGRWPDSLEALKDAGYLREVPTDPYDGQPLRLRRLDDGLVIYSIGPDGTDDGGKIDRQHPIDPGTDVGFRLWDSDKRRQPPAPFILPAAGK